MQRYLIKFSYLGTHFRGLQRQPGEILIPECPHKASMQTLIEKGLQRLEPVNEPIVNFSSRTDKGVHAICNIGHFDLQHSKEGIIYSPHFILKGLNRYLEKCSASILVRQIEPVPPTFTSRSASLSRQYLYRIAVGTDESSNSHKSYPVAEWKRCFFIKEPFSFDIAKEACQVLQGNGEARDYASFCHNLVSKHPNYPTVRQLQLVNITEGRPLLDPQYDSYYKGLRFFDIHVQARSFMYKQVRRMVGVVVAAAQNRISIDEVHDLFRNPGNWNSKVTTAPPHGLYLVDIELKPSLEDEQSQ